MTTTAQAQLVKVEGLKAVDANLALLGSKDGTRVLRKSMLMGGERILERAKSNIAAIEKGSGSLHKAMGMRFLVSKQKRANSFLPPMGGKFYVQIYPASANKVAIALYNTFYRTIAKRIRHGHLLEFGFVHRSGKRVRKQAFMKPAMDAEQSNAIAVFTREMKDGIDKLLRRNARRSKRAAKQ